MGKASRSVGRRWWWVILGIAAAAGPAAAQSPYPSKPVTLIVPYSAGGRTDLTGRLIAQSLKSHLGQPVVVENRPGAGGVIGAKELGRAAPDGYALGLFSTGFVVTQYTMPAATTLREYEAIALVNVDPAVLGVSAASGHRTVADVITFARANPGKLKVGVQSGASSHLFAAAFARAAGITVTYVPFKGDAENVVALAGGHIDAFVSVPVAFRSMVDAGKVRLVAVAAEKPLPGFESVPTFRTEGVDLVIGSWHGVFGPRALAPAAIEVVERALRAAAADPELRQSADRLLIGIQFRDRARFKAFLQEEDERVRRLVQEVGLQAGTKR
jgi:tripartite-type tricarboxylate transporter receptor subunit TctC